MNNVLLDEQTDRAICVIDLDTVMPGSALYDYGDAIRFGACTTSEEETDLGRVSVDMELFEAFTRGFLEAVGDRLTPDEIALLPVGAKMMACELSMRFLTDYLDGDVYFKTKYPTHNLDRAHAQMQLLVDMEKKEPEMIAVIERIVKGL
jgi:Ser/Thr protein kinase RdoA (MazF antagonist)